MTVYRGITRGNVVVLPDDAQLPDGLLVDVHVDASAVERETEAAREDAFESRLVQAGLLTLPRSASSQDSATRAPPTTIEGKPLSEMIIEERR